MNDNPQTVAEYMNIKQSTLANETYAKKDHNEDQMDKFKEHIGVGPSPEAQHI